VWLYRKQPERFIELLQQHLNQSVAAAHACFLDESGEQAVEPMTDFKKAYTQLRSLMQPFLAQIPEATRHGEIPGDFLYC
jgi:hypothetical protein